MSRSGYFKDLGNFGQQIINQVANDIRSNAENLVYSFGQDQQGGRTNPEETSGPSVSSPSGQDRPRHQRSSSTSSSQATTPEEVAGDWLNNVSTLSYLIVVLVLRPRLFDVGTFNENLMRFLKIAFFSIFVADSYLLTRLSKLNKYMFLRIYKMHILMWYNKT